MGEVATPPLSSKRLPRPKESGVSGHGVDFVTRFQRPRKGKIVWKSPHEMHSLRSAWKFHPFVRTPVTAGAGQLLMGKR